MEADLTEKKEDVTGKKGQPDVKKGVRFICSVGVYVFLFFLVAVYSFYAPEGYIQIATNKYLFFRKLCLATTAVMTPFVILYYILPSRGKRWEDTAEKVSVTDLFMFLYLCLNLITFYFTEYREEALWGTDGWYMGFVMQLFFIGIYFFISRFYDGRFDILPLLLAASFLVFLWGILNRFSIYPIDMQYEHEQFISSMGNINWFCGFWSVFFVTGVVLYVITKKRWMRILSGIYSVLALGLAAVEGSDSAFLSMGAIFFFLFLLAFQKTVYMKRWLELGIFYCAACQVMRVIVKLDRESLTMDTSTMWMMLGNLTLAVLIALCILRFLLEKADAKYNKNTVCNREKEIQERTSKEKLEKIGYSGKRSEETERSKKISKETGLSDKGAEKIEQPEKELIREWIWLKYAVVGMTVGGAVVFLALLIINTRSPGILGPLSRHSIFLFDGHWGSARGATWRDGLSIYQSFSWRERLFGVGQDCFAIYGYSIPELSARLTEEWPNSRLTNAHNECLTHLVNVGVFGMLAFIGIFVSSFKRLLERAKVEPLCYVFAASLLSYFVHNQFSFAQVLNVPYIYMMLGLGESLMRRDALKNRLFQRGSEASV